MNPSLALLPAVLIGLLGSAHCIGMCGGIVGALTLRLPSRARQSARCLLPYVLCYNLGRIGSYGFAGALAGLLGGQLLQALSTLHAQRLGSLISAAFMIVIGLYVAGWSRPLALLERLGARAWRWIEPLGRYCLPVAHPLQALMLGLVWGWLPCGLVYGALVLALASGGAAQGSVLMLAFGLGTLPTLLVLGTAAARLQTLAARPVVRRAVGIIILLFGIISAVVPALHSHAHHLMIASPSVGG